MKKVYQRRGFKSATFKGKKFQLWTGELDKDPNFAEKDGVVLGRCESRNNKNPRLTIDDRLVGLPRLETALHEALHACFDESLSEEDVTVVSRDISKFLFRMWENLTDDEILKRKKQNGH
jgi:hypothetical protein